MSVCPYFLRGNCRYGNRCRLPHVSNQNDPPLHVRPRRPPINPAYNYVASSGVSDRNHHVTNSTASKGTDLKYSAVFNWITENFANKNKALDILEQLQKEAKVWQKSDHLWKFTSKTLFPGGQPLPDWNDQSFEEVRWAYQCMASEKQDHVFKKTYFDYLAKTERQTVGLATLRIETLNSLKVYIDQFIASNYQPSKTLPTDIEMQDVNETSISNIVSQAQSTNYTPDDELLENERAAYESDTFEFGQIPMHAPSKQFC